MTTPRLFIYLFYYLFIQMGGVDNLFAYLILVGLIC